VSLNFLSLSLQAWTSSRSQVPYQINSWDKNKDRGRITHITKEIQYSCGVAEFKSSYSLLRFIYMALLLPKKKEKEKRTWTS